MTIELFVTFAITVGVPVFLVAEEVVRRLDLRSGRSGSKSTAAPRQVPARPLQARRAA